MLGHCQCQQVLICVARLVAFESQCGRGARCRAVPAITKILGHAADQAIGVLKTFLIHRHSLHTPTQTPLRSAADAAVAGFKAQHTNVERRTIKVGAITWQQRDIYGA